MRSSLSSFHSCSFRPLNSLYKRAEELAKSPGVCNRNSFGLDGRGDIIEAVKLMILEFVDFVRHGEEFLFC